MTALSAWRHDLQYLFEPRAIAHVGASSKTEVGRFNFTAFLKKMNYSGKLYPVNPKYSEVLDSACYPSLKDLPENVDLTILALPSTHCIEVLKDMPAGKTKFVVVHTSGFGEIDKYDLEAELLNLAETKDFHIIGPNCMGIFCQRAKVAFWSDHVEFAARPGWVGLISQSGGLTIDIISGSIDAGININKAVSLGNQIDVSINDLLEFMGQDETVRAIALYIEDIKDGRRFLELLRDITTHKPVLVWKGGLTPAGKAAAKTHTSALAGNEKVFLSALRQAGAILIDNLKHMLNTLRILSPQSALPGQNLAIVCPGGGNTVAINDSYALWPDINLPQPTPEGIKKLQTMLPEENIDLKNPIDPGGTGYTKIKKLLQVVGEDEAIDSIITVWAGDYFNDFENVEARKQVMEILSYSFSSAAQSINKPVFVHLVTIRDNNPDIFLCRSQLIEKLAEKNIPWLDGTFQEAALTFGRIAGYCRYLKERAK